MIILKSIFDHISAKNFVLIRYTLYSTDPRNVTPGCVVVAYFKQNFRQKICNPIFVQIFQKSENPLIITKNPISRGQIQGEYGALALLFKIK